MRAVILAGALALLAGCAPRAKDGAADAAAAQAALQRLKTSGPQVMGLALPGAMPPWAVLPPDAFVSAASQGEEGPASGWLEFSTALSPGAAAAFYAQALKAQGFSEVSRQDGGLVATAPGRRLTLSIRRLDGVGAEVRLGYR